MAPELFCLLIAASSFNLTTNSSTSSSPSDGSNTGVPASFRPSIAVIVGVLTTMFSLTFLLLIYAKHCKRSARDELFFVPQLQHPTEQQEQRQQQEWGCDADVVAALPTFTFGSLKGNKEGLECAVCLGHYEETELLRFLPKCKHAFHVHCLDTWLACRSTCPLCRHPVSALDAAAVVDMIRHSSSSMDDMHIYVHALQESPPPPLPLPPPPPAGTAARKVRHRIVLSDVVLQRRWSDVVPSDVLFIGGDSQALVWPAASSSILERPVSIGIGRSATRSMSELTGRRKEEAEAENSEHQRRWSSIAKRTLQWLTYS